MTTEVILISSNYCRVNAIWWIFKRRRKAEEPMKKLHLCFPLITRVVVLYGAILTEVVTIGLTASS